MSRGGARAGRPNLEEMSVDRDLRRLEIVLKLARTSSVREALVRSEEAQRISPEPEAWEPTLRAIRWELQKRLRRAS